MRRMGGGRSSSKMVERGEGGEWVEEEVEELTS